MSFDLKLVNGDLALAASKDLDIVKDNEKLYQDMLKIIISPLGSNKIHTWYGSSVNASLIGNPLSESIFTDAAEQQVISALENLQMLQKTQAKTQNVSNYERIVSIKYVSVEQSDSDPRLIEVKASVITGGLKNVGIKFFITI